MQTTAGVEETGESDREDRGWAGGEKEGVGGVPFEEMSVIKRKKKTVFLPPPHPPTYSCATSVHNSHNDDGT